MERIAFHLRIKDSKRDKYREVHEAVPDANKQAYLDADLEVSMFSVFEDDGHVFGFMETDDPEGVQKLLASNEALQAWSEKMDPILREQDAGIWMDEVYRMF
jgi:L-rhamnose mutarotase